MNETKRGRADKETKQRQQQQLCESYLISPRRRGEDPFSVLSSAELKGTLSGHAHNTNYSEAHSINNT